MIGHHLEGSGGRSLGLWYSSSNVGAQIGLPFFSLGFVPLLLRSL